MNKKTIGIIKLSAIIFFIIPPLFIFFQIYFSLKYENNPSSTSAIAYVTGPIIGCFYGLILSLIGLIIGKIAKTITNYKRVSIVAGLLSILIIAILSSIIGSYSGYQGIMEWNKKITPKVLITNNDLIKENIELFQAIKIPEWENTDNKSLFGERYKNTTLDLENSKLIICSPIKESLWKNQKIYLCFDSNNSYILTKSTENKYNILIKQNIEALSYITDVKGYEVEFNSKKYFVLLTVLRATLNRSYLTVYSNEEKIIYKELTGRIRNIKPIKLNNKEYLVTGNERYPKFVYYWK